MRVDNRILIRSEGYSFYVVVVGVGGSFSLLDR